jgi:acetyltransferase
VIVVKSGRTAASAEAACSHSGALAGSDAVYDAAFRRCGILRVETLRDLFDAAEILARWKTYAGPRLAIVTNGGGPAVLAADALVRRGGKLATFGPQTGLKLDEIVRSSSPHANPLDLGGDARPERYLAALEVVSTDPAVDAVLLMHAPTAVTSVAEVAAACVPALAQLARPVIACWLGSGGEGEQTREPSARRRASRHQDECSGGPGHGAVREALAVPTYSTPEEAVDAFLYVVRYQESQALLLEAPASIAEASRSDIQAARAIISRALTENRSTLTEPESKQVLAAYGIPVVETRVVRDAVDLAQAASSIGFPVALKVLSPDISHKSDVGGVALNLGSNEELQRAAYAMLLRCRELQPDARIEGFTVQKMVRRGGAHELFAGIAVDPTFGPTILFGEGGTAVEVIADRALALPPLNERLARDLIEQTRISRLLAGYRDRPPVNLASLESALVNLAQLAADMPEIVELDVNPLLTDEHGVLALDARIRVARSRAGGADRFAIRPYPAELEERAEFRGQPLILRPIRPEDFEQHKRFLAQVSPEDLRARFFATLREVPDRDLARLTQIDYDREMAFIAVASGEDGRPATLGVARASADPDNVEAEFAVLVRTDLKGEGLGRMLLEKLVRYCRQRGTQRMTGEVLSDNTRMTALASALGFRATLKDCGILDLELDLKSTALQSSPPEAARRSTPEPA